MTSLASRFRRVLLAGSAAALLAQASTAEGQVSVAVSWSAVGGQANPRLYGLNLWNGTDPNKTANANYQANVQLLTPGVARLHAAEIIDPLNSKAWVDAFGAWKPNVVDSVLTSLGPAQEVMLSVPDWYTIWDTPGSGRLDPAQITTYANHVASLVHLANNELGHNVAWIETFNERDNSYNGDSASLATIHNAVAAAVRAVDPDVKIAAGAWIQPFDDFDIRSFMSAVGSQNMDAFTYHHYATSGTSTDRTLLYDRASVGSSSVAGRAGAVRQWLDDIPEGEGVELWLSETNLYSNFANDTTGLMRGAVGGVWSALAHAGAIKRGDLDVLLPWNDSDNTFGSISPDGANLRPAGQVRRLMAEYLVGDWILSTSSSASQVETLAAADGETRALMLVNRSLQQQVVGLAGLDASGLEDPYTLFTVSGNGVTQTSFNLGGTSPADLVMAADTVAFLVFTSTAPIPTGDYNGDGLVDAADYTAWRDSLGDTVPAGTLADGSANGSIDEADYSYWSERYGSSLPSMASAESVPEPSGVWLAALAFLSQGLRRWPRSRCAVPVTVSRRSRLHG